MKRLLLFSLTLITMLSCREEDIPLHLGDVITRVENSEWVLSEFTVNDVNVIDSINPCIVNADVVFNENNRFSITSDDTTCTISQSMSEGFWNVDINSEFFSWFDVTNNQVSDFGIEDVQFTNFTISRTDDSGQILRSVYRLK